MTKAEKTAIVDWTESLSDEQLENEYYEAAFATLGSEAEEMYERGYDVSDIHEREKYEKALGEKADILEHLCAERGIKLWEGDGDNA